MPLVRMEAGEVTGVQDWRQSLQCKSLPHTSALLTCQSGSSPALLQSPEKHIALHTKDLWPCLPMESAWGLTMGFILPEKLLESQSVLVVRRGGVKASVATRYAGHHKQTTEKIHVLNGAEF